MDPHVDGDRVRRVIIESPFAGATPELAERNQRYLRACLRDCLLRGEAPFASHGLYTQPGVLDDNDNDEREHGMAAGFVWREGAHATVVYHDLGFTTGMRFGIEHAKQTIPESVWRWGEGRHALEYRLLGGEWDLGLSEVGRP
jgi:hypothetical protein